MQRRECLKGFVALAALGMIPAAVADIEAVRPLGRVRDLRADIWLSETALMKRLLAAEAVIVGEHHDNPEHHRLERWLINRLAHYDQLGGVAMEMLDPSQQARLARHSTAELLALSEADLRNLLQWNEGWDWQAYGPTLRRVLELGVMPRAANLERQTIKELVAANQAPELPQVVIAAQRQALIEGHCNMLPEHMLDGLLAAQVARDQAMAVALGELPATAVLICGSGHARRDLGVALHSDGMPLSLGLIELAPSQNDWRSALPVSVDDAPPYDLAWFTPTVERGDVCGALRERFAGGQRSK
ncbi:hypothetical protein L861_08105 [Litchfieldella anticariensis FP35 = DSM 16096]|uniref:Haem-binding uptake Tiki superfamily ChaN domain-containing protein n=1 Tax=Litchfieldella anticariensis (strain DSM 16096 / CECT 5854 / CIP 108499 / LMG 22089 / FP35) TaxID=1121939 RepID=S2KID9_LITA3|nr:ChaN family lipoprotein [Halomonas anticariensis]EPC00118.1 hypothetical protein L861_08105 [Halomonas anticariensis FP35 = DSM 16096]